MFVERSPGRLSAVENTIRKVCDERRARALQGSALPVGKVRRGSTGRQCGIGVHEKAWAGLPATSHSLSDSR